MILAGVHHPGDLVAISVDGLVCVAANAVAEVLAKACEIQTSEQARDALLRRQVAG